MASKRQKFREGKRAYAVEQVGSTRLFVTPWVRDRSNAYVVIDVYFKLTVLPTIGLSFLVYAPNLTRAPNPIYSEEFGTLQAALRHAAKLIETERSQGGH